MQNTVAGFKVKKDENVTIEVFPSQSLGNNFTAERDGDASNNAFQWQVTKEPGQGRQHDVLMFFDFTGAGPGSFYRIEFKGDADTNSGPFKRFVKFESPEKNPNYVFPVVA